MTSQAFRARKFIKRAWANLTVARPLDLQLERAIITFTFDDAPASAFRQGGNILYNEGCSGTFYVAMSLLNSRDRAAFNTDDLAQARRQAHDIGCHTYSHLDCSAIPLQVLREDMTRNAIAIRHWFGPDYPSSFSYPYGAQESGLKRHLMTRFRCARGNREGINVGTIDMFNLKAVQLYEQQNDISTIEQIIDRAVAEKAWLIFYTHDVADPFSPDGCSPGYLQDIVRYGKRKLADVLSMRQAMDAIESVPPTNGKGAHGRIIM